MEKPYFNCTWNSIRYVCVLVLLFSNISLVAEEATCCSCGLQLESEDFIDYEGLGEYEEMFREFELRAEAEDCQIQAKTFFLKKWCKKLKRWFKKTVTKVLKKMVNFKKFKSGEHCAYEVAHFKKKVDKKLHNTGGIDEMFSEFDNHSNVCEEANEGMNKFKERIRYYYTHENAKPPKHPDHDRYNFCVNCSVHSKEHKNNQLEDVPVRALIGGVEIACGSLIAVLPFPGCRWLGFSLITHGSSQIYEGYMQQYENDTHKAVVNP